MLFLCLALSLVTLLCMDSQDEDMEAARSEMVEPTPQEDPMGEDPLAGFLFSVAAAGFLMAIATLVVKCFCGKRCAASKYPGEGETRTVTEPESEGKLTKVYIGLPASSEDAQV